MISIEDGLGAYLKEVGKYPVLTREEEQDLFRRLRGGDESARERIVKCNLRFVVKIALRYQNQGLSVADLIQEGNIGLMEVTEKFDPERGFRFSTYAAFWIKQAIQQALCKQGRLVRLPIRKTRAISRIREASRAFVKTYGREPTSEELSRRVDMDVEHIEALRRMDEPSVSFDTASTDDGPTLESVLSEKDAPDPRDLVMEREMKSRVRDAVKDLSEREQNVLSLRFGFSGGKPLSLRRTSVHVGLSQEGVRRVERRALDKLRRAPYQEMIAGLI